MARLRGGSVCVCAGGRDVGVVGKRRNVGLRETIQWEVVDSRGSMKRRKRRRMQDREEESEEEEEEA